MQAARGALAIAGIAVLTLAACGGDANLIRMRSTGNGPDEFATVPQQPLQMPPSLNDLPTPTPGGANRTDLNPSAEAIAALGGNPNAARTIPSSDAAIVANAGRYGTETGVRGTLAAEDREFRSNNRGRFLNRLFGTTTYYDAYGNEILDPNSELGQWRATGRRTPAAPPAAE